MRLLAVAVLVFSFLALVPTISLVSSEPVGWNSCEVKGNAVAVEKAADGNALTIVFETALARNNSEAPCFFHANEEVTAVYNKETIYCIRAPCPQPVFPDLRSGDSFSAVLFQDGEQDNITNFLASVSIINPSCAPLENCGIDCGGANGGTGGGLAKNERGCYECACSALPVVSNEAVFRFSFQKGWNYYSYPLAQERDAFCKPGGDCLQRTDFLPRIVATDCETQSVLWRWTDGGKTYSEYQFPDLGKKESVSFAGELLAGYWFKALAACSVTIAGDYVQATRLDGKQLFKGWNSLGAPSVQQTSGIPFGFDSVKGDCVVEKGPYGWDAAQQKFVKSLWLEPGAAYFVKVVRDCRLSVQQGMQ